MPKHALIQSAYSYGRVDPIDVLAFHRSTFGRSVMEDNGDGGTSGTGENAAEPTLNEHGFPDKTPIASMTAEQQVAYWKHQARKHEGTAKQRDDYDDIKAERDRLKAAGLSESEKAIEAARAEARTQAEKDVTAKYAARLVAAESRTAIGDRRTREQVADLLDGIDLSKFLTTSGEVDADKVSKHAELLAPKSTADTGQGRRGGSSSMTKREAGIAEARKRFPQKTTQGVA